VVGLADLSQGDRTLQPLSRARLAFGVGTNLTNDLGYTPLQIVIKMVRCNGQPVAKLSDAPEKNMCEDTAYLAYLRQVFELTH
jgi:nicotinate phosphoribosyltransferase